MKNGKDIMYKMSKISKIVGSSAVFRIGADTKRKKFDLLSINICAPEDNKEIIEIPDKTDYIG